jgi:hypothetical protein
MIRNALIVLCGLAIAMPVMAERGRARARNDAEALRAAYRMARCQYERRPDAVVDTLNAVSDADRDKHQRQLQKIIQCHNAMLMDGMWVEGVSVQTPPDVLRGMLAEAALYNMKQDDALDALPAQASYVRPWFAVSGRDPVANEMAVCVAEQNPRGIRTLLATDRESSEELAATRALSGSLGPCLPKGATLKANRQSLRAALAEALFHRATAPALATTN